MTNYYTIIASPRYVGDSESQGTIRAEFRSLAAAQRRLASIQRTHRRANPGGSYLHLVIVLASWSNGEQARGVVVH